MKCVLHHSTLKWQAAINEAMASTKEQVNKNVAQAQAHVDRIEFNDEQKTLAYMSKHSGRRMMMTMVMLYYYYYCYQ